MLEEEKPEPKFREGDEVYVGDSRWIVHDVLAFEGPVLYDLYGYYTSMDYKFHVPEAELHRLPLYERLNRIEAALGLESE